MNELLLNEVFISSWIPVSERLPKKVKDVFNVTIKRLSDEYIWVQNLLWHYDEWKWWEEDEEEIYEEEFEILAWMPLPDPYKEI